MSKKNEQPNENPQPTPEFAFDESAFEQGNVGTLELTYLINSILDYYQDEDSSDGDSWKRETGLSKKNIPADLDAEVKKTFISQLRKFQND